MIDWWVNLDEDQRQVIRCCVAVYGVCAAIFGLLILAGGGP